MHAHKGKSCVNYSISVRKISTGSHLLCIKNVAVNSRSTKGALDQNH